MYRKFILKDNTNPAQIRRIWAKSGAGAGFVKMAGFRIYRSRSRNRYTPSYYQVLHLLVMASIVQTKIYE